MYGKSPEEAKAKAPALALRTPIDRLENGEAETDQSSGLFHIALASGPAPWRAGFWRGR